VLITKEKHFPGLWALLPTLGAAFIILSGAQAWFNRKILSNSILVWLGLISFPLYLWHWPLLFFAGVFEEEKSAFKLRILIIIISCLLAWFTYKFIEKPIRLGADSTHLTGNASRHLVQHFPPL
jgi:peptidoglycan/LPS O-acetylase OafA/YrhL